MRKFIRAGEPAICKAHSARWNAQWVALRTANPNAGFSWYNVEGKSARDHMLPALREQSQRHCSFCDAFPVDGVSNETIEHFQPKGRFLDRAYTWANLYYCCDACQREKGELWDDQLLHADADDYLFSRYFEFDFTTGEIRPNPLASQSEQHRAATTVKLYGLDSTARRRNRLDEARRYAKCEPGGNPAELWAYRDFLSLAETSTPSADLMT